MAHECVPQFDSLPIEIRAMIIDNMSYHDKSRMAQTRSSNLDIVKNLTKPENIKMYIYDGEDDDDIGLGRLRFSRVD